MKQHRETTTRLKTRFSNLECLSNQNPKIPEKGWNLLDVFLFFSFHPKLSGRKFPYHNICQLISSLSRPVSRFLTFFVEVCPFSGNFYPKNVLEEREILDRFPNIKTKRAKTPKILHNCNGNSETLPIFLFLCVFIG